MSLPNDNRNYHRRGIDVDAILSELLDIRAQSQQSRYKDGIVPALPSNVTIKEIVDGIISILYLRHFNAINSISYSLATH